MEEKCSMVNYIDFWTVSNLKINGPTWFSADVNRWLPESDDIFRSGVKGSAKPDVSDVAGICRASSAVVHPKQSF